MSTDIRSLWDRVSPLPGGRRIFSILLGRIVPYTGSIKPLVLELTASGARIQLRDRRAVRNHLRSIPAIALANIAELTTGLPLAYAVMPAGRTILLSLTVDFVKKARGTVTATSSFVPPSATHESEIEIPVEVRDESNEVVVRARARWRVGPVQRRG